LEAVVEDPEDFGSSGWWRSEFSGYFGTYQNDLDSPLRWKYSIDDFPFIDLITHHYRVFASVLIDISHVTYTSLFARGCPQPTTFDSRLNLWSNEVIAHAQGYSGHLR
jgi:hypothetical protein